MRWSDQRQILGTLTEFTPAASLASVLARFHSSIPRLRTAHCLYELARLAPFGDGRLLVLPHHRHSVRIFPFFFFFTILPCCVQQGRKEVRNSRQRIGLCTGLSNRPANFYTISLLFFFWDRIKVNSSITWDWNKNVNWNLSFFSSNASSIITFFLWKYSNISHQFKSWRKKLQMWIVNIYVNKHRISQDTLWKETV